MAVALKTPGASPEGAVVNAHPTGWRAKLDLEFDVHRRRTVMTGRRHEGPLRVQRSFHPEGAPCHAYILHPPGGVVGGDSLQTRGRLRPGAWATITSPGATKFYRSLGETAHLDQSLRVDAGATLEWFPQEQIVFNGAVVDAITRIDLEPGARCLAWEINCLGRPAGDQPFEQGRLRQRFQVWRGGRPLLLEHARIAGEGPVAEAHWGLRGQPAFATLVATPADADDLAAVREDLAPLPGPWAVTLLDDLLVVRWFGPGAREAGWLRDNVWHILRPRLLGRPVCRPRIWDT